jgi:hypothetical protein
MEEHRLRACRSRQLAVLSCIVSNCYLAMAIEQTEDFMCAVVLVMQSM